MYSSVPLSMTETQIRCVFLVFQISHVQNNSFIHFLQINPFSFSIGSNTAGEIYHNSQWKTYLNTDLREFSNCSICVCFQMSVKRLCFSIQGNICKQRIEKGDLISSTNSWQEFNFCRQMPWSSSYLHACLHTSHYVHPNEMEIQLYQSLQTPGKSMISIFLMLKHVTAFSFLQSIMFSFGRRWHE